MGNRGREVEGELATAVGMTATDPGAAVGPRRVVGILAGGAAVGRYVILHLLGEGAMGQVYAGYDVQLDRKVALKMIRAELVSPRIRERTLREAQALAKLSHPNVVQVYEVGEHQGRLYVAMEYVDGADLRSWLGEAARPWSEILEVMIAAARGLAAAHASGLVHRDVKPDNILVGRDGRARIADFGLVRAAGAHESGKEAATAETTSVSGSSRSWREVILTQDGHSIGTPAYMSPEQHQGGEVGPLSDQFSLCVTLFEVLYGRRPFCGETVAALREQAATWAIEAPPAETSVPRRIERVLRRGLSPLPAARWPGIDALVAALRDDPSQQRRRIAGLTLAAGLVASGGYALASLQGGVTADPCQGGEAALAGVWDPGRRAGLRGAFTASADPLATGSLPRVERALDAYSAEWVGLYTELCRDHQRGVVSPLLLDRGMACLERRRGELGALVEVLIEAEEGTAANAVIAAASLPRLAACRDREGLLAAVPGPTDPAVAAEVAELQGELGRALALESAGRYADGLELVAALGPRVDGLDAPGLLAEHRLRSGSLRMWSDDFTAAEGLLAEAHVAAIRGHDEPRAIEALAKRIYVVGEGELRDEAAEDWYAQALAWLDHVDDDRDLRALLLLNMAVLRAKSGRLREALAMTEAARDLWQAVYGAEHHLVAFAWNNLASTFEELGRCDDALAALEQAQALVEVTLGPGHPVLELIAANRCSMGRCRGDLEASRRCLARLLEGEELTPYSLNELAWAQIAVLHNLGDLGGARGLVEGLLSLPEGVLSPVARGRVELVLGELLHDAGELAEALALVEAVRDRSAEGEGRGAVTLAWAAEVGWASIAVDRALSAREAAREAATGPPVAMELAALAGSLEALVERGEALFPEQPWEVAQARFAQARALAGLGSRERGEALARRADRDLAAQGPIAGSPRAAIAAWLAAP